MPRADHNAAAPAAGDGTVVVMSRLVLASTALASALAAAPAAAAVLVGDVVATRAAWSADDRAIVTTATVRSCTNSEA